MQPPDYYDTLRALVQPIRAADLPHTLDHVTRLLDALGSPQVRYRSIVVTGSTGKGTTCLRIAETLNAAGQKVGLYTSPHLHLFRERFALLASSRRLITQAEWVEVARTVLDAERRLNQRYSTFETATAIALLWFARQQIDTAVLEIGIGGRFDAVNAVENDLAIFTPIEAEHVAMLGGSLESVAWHKAGIIRRKAISVPQTPEVMAVLEREAQARGADLTVVTPDESGAILLPEYPPPPAGLTLPGRLERIRVGGHELLIDGGHTPNAARFLRRAMGSVESIRLIAGMLRDKNAAAYLSVFDAPNVHLIYTRAPGDRALSADQLLERYRPAQASVTLIPSLDEALRQVETAREARVVVAGSLRMAAAAREALGLLTAAELEEARLTRAIFEGEDYQKKLKGS